MKVIFAFIVIVLVSFACQKKNIEVPFEEIQGDYEWFYSENGQAFDVSEDQFGIRLTKNGRLKFFKNGKEEQCHKIYETTEIASGDSNIRAGDDEDYMFCSVYSDTLWTWNYPHDGHRNYYVKTK